MDLLWERTSGLGTVCREGYRFYVVFPPGVGEGEAVGRYRALARVLLEDRGRCSSPVRSRSSALVG